VRGRGLGQPRASVDDLANALAELPVWESTRPAPRSIGGHQGVFIEPNVPAHIPGNSFLRHMVVCRAAACLQHTC
jgi:hypothetical protein